MNTFQINTEVHFGAKQRALCEIIIQKGLDYEDHSKPKLGKIYSTLGKMKVEKMGKNVLKDSFHEFEFQGKLTEEWREFITSNGRKMIFILKFVLNCDIAKGFLGFTH